jgi:HEAT repeat protein
MSHLWDLKLKKLVDYSSRFISSKRFLSHDVVFYLLKALETSDYQLSVDIENDLVSIGDKAILPLLNALNSPNGKVRSTAAMALIRIGVDCIEPLMSLNFEKESDKWLRDFIIAEILGSQSVLENKKTYKSIAS